MPKIIKSIELRYQNYQENSHKFYIISMYDDLTIITRWGRIGSEGRFQTKKHQFLWSAENYYNQKRKEKENKGYYIYQNNSYTQPENRYELNNNSAKTNTNSKLVNLDIWDAEF